MDQNVMNNHFIQNTYVKITNLMPIFNTVFGSRERGRIDCGRRESTEIKIFPPFGILVREERKINFHGSHS
jgi:hypothetical protein